ncbi:GNAT family N-acetyltransferase [Pseudenhygromyxa sp. WMMC2535]|uniref:GNAT family N-acetyltransferase n=1 Tax=Pseudenhygromyxa sp. WMMC2535 TaxID=2712867 RepID=UPI001557DF00|nr:GNAT family N-acetyltransferase [Pseudenhygromyxa sp. WMMC2535]NVB37339.1 GNAT family N-acetyltransferase [Pseudenhygromyxa sp. WMMC2535]
MSAYIVKNLEPTDFDALMTLEEDVFGAEGESTLGPYYVRLCCDFFGQHCFLCLHEGKPAGYLLSFVREREAYCTTLAVVPEFQGTRCVALLLRAFVSSIADRVDSCWFTVKEDNKAARALHASLGATETGVRQGFYGPGDERIVSKIDAEAFAKLRARYERLGLLQRRAEPELATPAPIPSMSVGAPLMTGMTGTTGAVALG